MHSTDTPVFHVQPAPDLGRRMMQYMAALKFCVLIPSCRISGVSLPSWGIEHPAIVSPGPIASEDEAGAAADLLRLAGRVSRGEIRRIEWGAVTPRMDHFLRAERYRPIFNTPPMLRGIGYGADTLVCPLGTELDPADAPPVEFFRHVIEKTGTHPVFIGGIRPDPYIDQLRATFPDASFRPPQADPMVDFETIRQSRNIALGGSLLAWLAAWLADAADTIFLALSGPLNPACHPLVNLLPLGDQRFRIILLPELLPPALHPLAAPGLREVPHDTLRQMLRETTSPKAFNEGSPTAGSAGVANTAGSSGEDNSRPYAPKYRFSLVACARWEEDTIQEWIEYHRSVGFEHIYLYSNDDDPEPLFKAVAPWVFGPSPFVTFRYWAKPGDQIEIYLHFLQHYRHETEWFSFLDIDEFFVFRGIDNVARFMQSYQDSVDCLYFNWFTYGNNGKVKREPGFTLTNYPRRSDQVDAHTKMLCRASLVDPEAVRHGLQSGRGAFHHFLDNYSLPGLRCADVVHGSTAGYSRKFPESAEAFVRRPGFSEAVIERAYVAHFQFRSEEDFIRRWHRAGRGNNELWRRLYETGGHRAVLKPNNAVYDSYLADYWHRYTAAALRFVDTQPYGSPPFTNVALNKPSSQSSMYQPTDEEPKRSRVSGAGNNGIRTGTYGFHTQCESGPWWCVDLLRPHRIAEIHIYNRVDTYAVASRAARIEVLSSLDQQSWTTLVARNSDEPFGLDGIPLVIASGQGVPCRFLLLRLPTTEYLHLDEVEVYGEPL